MVVKITTPTTISKALRYNEKKVQNGAARCLYAGNFLKDANNVNFHEKLGRFEALNRLNTRARTNTLHISLNFHPSEKVEGQKLVQIAETYMEKIGFGAQPYLVYEHRDAGHPHIHIVTSTIRENGQRIDTYNIGKNASGKARKEIEHAFGLVRTGDGFRQQNKTEEHGTAQKIRYGKVESKQAVSNVLNEVIHGYHFTSLAELNAILRLYHLEADAGAEGSHLHRNGGLLYHILDADGKPIGVPLKASSIVFGPTLKSLEKRFIEGVANREPHARNLKTAIDFQLYQNPANLTLFIDRMRSEKISVVPQQNKEGFVYGITFIDHRTKSVFNGSDLGKSYSATGLQKRILENKVKPQNSGALLLQKKSQATATVTQIKARKSFPGKGTVDPEKRAAGLEQATGDWLYQLWKIEKEGENTPFQFRKKNRRKSNPKP